jgi:hypothetical protein
MGIMISRLAPLLSSAMLLLTTCTPPPRPASTAPVEKQVQLESLAELPPCGEHQPVPIQKRFCDMPFVLEVAEDMQAPGASFVLASMFESGGITGRCIPDEDEEWMVSDTGGDQATRHAQLADLEGEEVEDLCRIRPSAMCYYWVGHDEHGAPICVQRDGDKPYVVQFHDLAPMAVEQFEGEELLCWDPCCALGAWGVVITGTVLCPDCSSSYVRVWAEATEGSSIGEPGPAGALDAVVGEEFHLGASVWGLPPSPGIHDIHAVEVLGPHEGVLRGVEVSYEMSKIEIVME